MSVSYFWEGVQRMQQHGQVSSAPAVYSSAATQ